MQLLRFSFSFREVLVAAENVSMIGAVSDEEAESRNRSMMLYALLERVKGLGSPRNLEAVHTKSV